MSKIPSTNAQPAPTASDAHWAVERRLDVLLGGDAEADELSRARAACRLHRLVRALEPHRRQSSLELGAIGPLLS